MVLYGRDFFCRRPTAAYLKSKKRRLGGLGKRNLPKAKAFCELIHRCRCFIKQKCVQDVSTKGAWHVALSLNTTLQT